MIVSFANIYYRPSHMMLWLARFGILGDKKDREPPGQHITGELMLSLLWSIAATELGSPSWRMSSSGCFSMLTLRTLWCSCLLTNRTSRMQCLRLRLLMPSPSIASRIMTGTSKPVVLSLVRDYMMAWDG